MPFDPNYPPTNALIESAPLRAQFQGLVDLISSIPQGPQGPPGQNGSDGGPGPIGPQGPPFANAVVDGVTTLPAGSPAQVSVSFDGVQVHFTFSIPQGFDGATGPQGLPGEVTQSDLNNAMATTLGQTSNNSNAVSTLALAADGAYNAAQLQAVMDKLDELINALRR